MYVITLNTLESLVSIPLPLPWPVTFFQCLEDHITTPLREDTKQVMSTAMNVPGGTTLYIYGKEKNKLLGCFQRTWGGGGGGSVM